MEKDYYELLNLKIECSQNEIRKAYYHKALKYHPDKRGQDDKESLKIFLELTKAYDVLSDPKKRREYDEKLKAKLQQKARIEKFDAKRRQMKEDLDLKERAFKRQKTEEVLSQEQLKNEINRLREEGIRILNQVRGEEEEEEENNNINIESQISDMDKTLILKWKNKKYNYTQKDLEEIFLKYGECLIVMKDKGSAAIQYKSLYSAYSVMMDKQEKCNKFINKIKISWAGKEEPQIIKKFESNFQNEYKKYRSSNQSNINDSSKISEFNINDYNNSNKDKIKIEVSNEEKLKHSDQSSFSSNSFGFSFNATEKMNMSLDDYENYTLMKMRKLEKEKMKEALLKENDK
ncbi:DnaJ-domain-containing protein [Anaeromyces robustus]|uniref:DnaJ-domain-containing protein n=1 Tax=Anaeromyces robustus TaxID=1754192 RepID=A0A1Y1XA67_9FUNG|nr:DnaJ-domain-containing protein [Anaeromyces robustus]|eukprot:ORX82642.1 DnaJ-domain-containing protein [Anaeromyces robustus]